MITGHVIDMQELRAREIAEWERKAHEQHMKAERKRMEYENVSRQINDAAFRVSFVYSQIFGSLLAGLLIDDTLKELIDGKRRL